MSFPLLHSSPTARRRAVFALVFLLAATSAAQAQTAAPAAGMAHGHTPARAGAAAPRDMKAAMLSGMDDMQKMPTTGDIDRDFAMLMKMHHEQALPMADLQLRQGKSPELKALARQIIAAQKKEIAQFDRWLAKQK